MVAKRSKSGHLKKKKRVSKNRYGRKQLQYQWDANGHIVFPN